jgi:DNA-binding NarL/FixJ family response regulator
MKLGCSGYLTKKCAGEIVETIHAVSRGEEYFVKRFEKKYLIPLQRQFKIN